MEIKKEGKRGKSLPKKKKNPLGPKGKPWTCHYCGSEYHFIGNCDKRKKEAKLWKTSLKVKLCSVRLVF